MQELRHLQAMELATVITFPALDSQNQVWIMKSGFGKERRNLYLKSPQLLDGQCSEKCGLHFQSQAGFQRCGNDAAKTHKTLKNRKAHTAYRLLDHAPALFDTLGKTSHKVRHP